MVCHRPQRQADNVAGCLPADLGGVSIVYRQIVQHPNSTGNLAEQVQLGLADEVFRTLPDCLIHGRQILPAFGCAVADFRHSGGIVQGKPLKQAKHKSGLLGIEVVAFRVFLAHYLSN